MIRGTRARREENYTGLIPASNSLIVLENIPCKWLKNRKANNRYKYNTIVSDGDCNSKLHLSRI